jgi:hypothetical protein
LKGDLELLNKNEAEEDKDLLDLYNLFDSNPDFHEYNDASVQ